MSDDPGPGLRDFGLATSLVSLLMIAAIGGCIGSFLNVVIYRWPRGLSTRQPARSFCPHCESLIAWFDNIPVLSYLALQGRCRHCRAGISLQYPLVELACATLFLIVYDAFFISHTRLGISHLQNDWIMLLGHWVLVGGLLALTVMDLEAYTVDIRVTWIVSAVGLLAHACWTPVSSLPIDSYAPAWSSAMETSGGWLRPGAGLALFSVAVAIGLAIRLAGNRQNQPLPDVEEPLEPESLTDAGPTHTTKTRGWFWILPLSILLGIYAVDVWRRAGADVSPTAEPGNLMGLGCAMLATLLVLTLAAGHPRQEADREIEEVLTEEAPEARGVAWQELRWLAPAIVLGIAAIVMVCSRWSGQVYSYLDPLLHAHWGGQWQPVWGLATGLAGWVVGGLIGWAARLVFTLCLGKEALGLGDVHILAAAGAVAGWPVAILGFFLAAPLALLAVGVNVARRRTRALAYGPWLAFGFLSACLFQDMMLRWLGIRWLLE